jgi:hypothetical protein
MVWHVEQLETYSFRKSVWPTLKLSNSTSHVLHIWICTCVVITYLLKKVRFRYCTFWVVLCLKLDFEQSFRTFLLCLSIFLATQGHETVWQKSWKQPTVKRRTQADFHYSFVCRKRKMKNKNNFFLFFFVAFKCPFPTPMYIYLHGHLFHSESNVHIAYMYLTLEKMGGGGVVSVTHVEATMALCFNATTRLDVVKLIGILFFSIRLH